jgi:hypothetical protein
MIDFKNEKLKKPLKIIAIIFGAFVINELLTLGLYLMTQPDTYLFYLGLFLNSIIGGITGYYVVNLLTAVLKSLAKILKNSKDGSTND